MRVDQTGSRLGRMANRPSPRMRVGLIAATSIAAGLVTAAAAVGTVGPFVGLRPYVASNLVHSTKSQTPIDAHMLFPKPPPLLRAAPPMHAAYVRPADDKPPGPPNVIDDLPLPAPPADAGEQGGGES